MSFYDRQFLGLNPRDFGAKGDGVTDDTLAFQACQAEAISSGLNAVSFDDGVYVIGDVGVARSDFAYLLGDVGVEDFLLEGSGPGSVLLINPAQTGSLGFFVIGLSVDANPISKRVVIRNFRIDGNRSNVTGIALQTISGISLVECEDCRVENVIVHDLPGDESVGNQRRADGIIVGGSSGEFSKRCIVRNCISYGNVGSGFEVRSVDEYTSIENCIAYDNWAPDISVRNLSSGTVQRAVFFRNCTMVAGPNAVSPDEGLALQIDADVAEAGQDLQIDGCSILGRVQVFDTDRAYIDDSIIWYDESVFLMRLNGNADRVIVSDSIIGMDGTTGVLFGLEQLGGGAPKVDWALRNNIMLPSSSAIAGTGFVGGDAEIEGNTIIYTGATLANYQISLRGADTASSVRIRRNVIVGDSYCAIFRAAVANAWPSLVITDNFLGVTNLILPLQFQLSGGTYKSRAVIHNNILSSVMTRLLNLSDLGNFPQDAIIVGGNYDTFDNLLEFALPHCLGDGSPNGTVFGRVGDEYTDIAGGAGTIHYVKDSGNVTSGGWVGK